MPHVPGQGVLAPMTQTPAVPAASKPAAQASGKVQAWRRVRVGPPKISPFKHTVDPDRVYHHLFGKEFAGDERTGICNMVPPAARR